jgi:hypothetical protein
MGEVADELSAFARRSSTAAVVMGAVSRSAITRLFIGNAAERALDRLNCDVLIVKPRGFRSSVRRRPQTAARRARPPRTPSLRRTRNTGVAIEPLPPPFL